MDETSTVYCRQCEYILDGIEENRCPECGAPFNPADPDSWLSAAGLKRKARARVIDLVFAGVSVGAVLVYWGQVAGVVSPFVIYPPPIGLLVKLTLVVGVVRGLSRVLPLLSGSWRRALVLAAAWGGAAAIVISSLLIFRNDIAALVNNETTAIIPTQTPAGMSDTWLDHYVQRVLLPRWGEIIVIETLLAAILIMLNCIFGVTLGRRRWACTLAGAAASSVLVIMIPIMFELFVLDWDDFHYGLWSNALCYDLMILGYSSSVTTPITAVVLASMIVSSWFGYLVIQKVPASRAGR